MRPKVFQIIDTLGMGGAETWLMEVLRLWNVSGAGRMDFLATSGQRGLFDAEAEALGARMRGRMSANSAGQRADSEYPA